jgi:hypothetical protein
LKKVFKFAGIAAIAVYIIFTLISHLQSRSMGPFQNWLGDYGSPENPGAIFYKLGCVLAAVLLVIFYTGMMSWHRGAEKKYVVCYICAEAGGLAAAIAMALAALIHGTSGDTLRIIYMAGMDVFLVSTAIAAFIDPFVSGFVGVFGIITAAFNIFTSNFLTRFYIGEWVFFALFMVYIVAITYNYDRFNGQKMKAAHAMHSGQER